MSSQFLKFLLGLMLILSVTLSSMSAHARWATRDDANTEIVYYNRFVEIHKDGSSVERVSMKTRPLKEDGGESVVTQPLSYSAANESFRFISGKVIYDGQEHKITKDEVEDKPIASTPQGFRQINQVLVNFPFVKKGAELYLEYELHTKEPPVPGFFSTNFVYGMHGYWVNSHVHVTSEIPFYIQSSGTENIVEIQQGKEGSKYFLDLVLKQPVIRDIVDEPMAAVDQKIFPWVQLSTKNVWADLAKEMSSNYEKIANQKLPLLFQEIANEAALEKSPIDQINKVTTLLADRVKYWGDWRLIKNYFFPRDLEKIASSTQGDCKDFSIATVAILRKLGIQAYPAIVQRGEYREDWPVNLPNTKEFNHAIVYAKLDEKILWIDPTNLVSYAHGAFPDIADRKALVFAPQAFGLQQIPAINPKDARVTVYEIDHFTTPLDSKKFHLAAGLPKTSIVHRKGKAGLYGVGAISMTGTGLRTSKVTTDYHLIRYLADESRLIRYEFAPYDLTSRLVRDLEFSFEIEEKSGAFKTDAGPVFLLPSNVYSYWITVNTRNRVSDLYLGVPFTIQKTVIAKNISRIQKKFKGCNIRTPWIDLSRKILDIGNNTVQIEDLTVMKTSKISNQDLLSPEFERLQAEFDHCFNSVGIVYKNP